METSRKLCIVRRADMCDFTRKLAHKECLLVYAHIYDRLLMVPASGQVVNTRSMRTRVTVLSLCVCACVTSLLAPYQVNTTRSA